MKSLLLFIFTSSLLASSAWAQEAARVEHMLDDSSSLERYCENGTAAYVIGHYGMYTQKSIKTVDSTTVSQRGVGSGKSKAVKIKFIATVRYNYAADKEFLGEAVCMGTNRKNYTYQLTINGGKVMPSTNDYKCFAKGKYWSIEKQRCETESPKPQRK